MKRLIAGSLTVLLVGAASLGGGARVTNASSRTDAALLMARYGSATLNAIGMSKAMGAVAIFGDGGGLAIAVSVSGLKPMSMHAEKIRAGICGSNGSAMYPLAALAADANGNATAMSHIRTLSVPKSGWYVNVDATDGTPISCGNVHRVGRMVRLTAINGSASSGVGLITTMARGTEVVVYVTHVGANMEHPAHLHIGRCNTGPNPIAYPLANLISNAKGEAVAVTFLTGPVSLSGLYLNVHGTYDDLGVACGNL